MKSKASRITLIGLFLILLYVPGIVWLIAGNQLETPNLENRELAEWPAFSLKNIQKLPGKYEAYYLDHLPFRNQVIAGYALGLKTVFDDAVVTTVNFGKDDWFIYNNIKDGDPIASYRGEDLLSAAELRQIVMNLRKTQANLASQGIDFVLFIAPNKERVYSEYMPDRFGEPAEDYGVRQLVDFLRAHTDIRVVYAYDELMQFKAENPDLPLYFRSDTHWNGLGAYIGARALLRELGIDIPALEAQNIEQFGDGYRGDLSRLTHLYDFTAGEALYTVRDDNRPNHNSLSDDGLTFHAQGDPQGKKVFFKNDSFLAGMQPYVFPWFSECYSYFNHQYTSAQVDEFQPDIFVQVLVERNVRSTLSTGPIYQPAGTE